MAFVEILSVLRLASIFSQKQKQNKNKNKRTPRTAVGVPLLGGLHALGCDGFVVLLSWALASLTKGMMDATRSHGTVIVLS